MSGGIYEGLYRLFFIVCHEMVDMIESTQKLVILFLGLFVALLIPTFAGLVLDEAQQLEERESANRYNINVSGISALNTAYPLLNPEVINDSSLVVRDGIDGDLLVSGVNYSLIVNKSASVDFIQLGFNISNISEGFAHVMVNYSYKLGHGIFFNTTEQSLQANRDTAGIVSPVGLIGVMVIVIGMLMGIFMIFRERLM